MKDTAKSSSVDVEAEDGKEKEIVTEKCGNIEEKGKRNQLNMQSKPRIPTEDSEDQGEEKESNIDELSAQISGLRIKTENNLSDQKLNNLGGNDSESDKECNSPEADGDDGVLLAHGPTHGIPVNHQPNLLDHRPTHGIADDHHPDLLERGPTHGVPISQHPLVASISRKHFPLPHTSIQNYPDYSNYNPNVCYNMPKGKRGLDSEVDEAYKYMRPPTDMVMPPSYPQPGYPMTSTPYNIPGPPAYGTQQMPAGYQAPQFGILPEPQPQMTSELLVTGSANMSGGKVVVNSPGAGSGPPSFPGISDPKFVDDFLESIDHVDQVGGQFLTNIQNENIFGDNCGQQTRFLPTSHSQSVRVQPGLNQPMGTHVSLSQPMGAQISTAQQMAQVNIGHMAQTNQLSQNMPMNTILPPQTTEEMRQFSGPKYQNRRASDLDSGTESAGEQSPYSEQAPSPANSTYTSPPSNPPSNMSEDSGFGKSPPYDPFSPAPDNRCPSTMSAGIMSPDNRGGYGAAGSPPKYINSPPGAGYRATPSPSSQPCFSPPARIPSESAGSTQSMVTSPVTSPMAVTPASEKYIDENLDSFLDVLDVVAKDIKSSHEKKVKPRPVQPETGNVAQMSQDPAKIAKQTMVPVPSNVAPLSKVIPQQQQGMMKMPLQPPPATTSQVIILNHQSQIAQPVTTSGAVVIIPAPGVQPIPNPPTLLVVSGQPQPKVSPKPQSKFREIRPKLPTNGMGPGDGSSNGSPSPKRVPAKSSNQNMGSGQNVQQTQQAMAQQQKQINFARRTVAGIPREGLMASDEEGDTYLHIAVCKTDRFMVQALLERLRREDLLSMIDQENKKRQTPLFLAVAINQPVMVALFNKFRANVNVLAQNLSSDGQTTEVKAAIHVAAVQGSESERTIKELLKAQDISVNIVNNDGQTALHCAILAHGKPKPHSSDGRIDSTPIIEALIKAGADASAQDKKSGKTPLMYAIEQKDVQLVETILLAVEATKARNIVRTQAFDGRSCLRIAEGLESEFPQQTYNRMWDMLQNAANGNVSRIRHY